MPARSITAILVGLLVTTATLAAAQQGNPDEQKPPAIPTVRLDIQVQEDGTAHAFVEQTWNDDDAKRMRQSLDAYFGAGDGTLSPSDLERIARATEADMRAKQLGWLTSEGVDYLIANVSVDFANATGPVEATHPLSMTHELQLRLNATAASANNTTGATQGLRIQPLWPGELLVQPPPGEQAVATAGLDNNVTDEDGKLRGSFVAGRDVLVAFEPQGQEGAEGVEGGGEDPTDAGASPDEATGEPRKGIPGPAALGTLLVLLGVSVAMAGRIQRR